MKLIRKNKLSENKPGFEVYLLIKDKLFGDISETDRNFYQTIEEVEVFYNKLQIALQNNKILEFIQENFIKYVNEFGESDEFFELKIIEHTENNELYDCELVP